MRGMDCVAHKHNALVAQERHHLQPQSRGGKTKADNMRWLCANAHGDTHYLLDLIEDHAAQMIGTDVSLMTPVDVIPWRVMRTYGHGVREAAVAGWARYGFEFLRGDYRAHRLIWSTSGLPARGAHESYVNGPLVPYSVAEVTGQTFVMLAVARRTLAERGR